MVESGIFYGTFVDPLLARLRTRVTAEIRQGETVIDIACGTGAQVFDLYGIASKAVGIDLSESMIDFAKNASRKRNIPNAGFFVCDAANLSAFEAGSFDAAIMSLEL